MKRFTAVRPRAWASLTHSSSKRDPQARLFLVTPQHMPESGGTIVRKRRDFVKDYTAPSCYGPQLGALATVAAHGAFDLLFLDCNNLSAARTCGVASLANQSG